MFDITIAVLAAIAALPVALLIALAIVLESGGPALFGHTRIGRGRKPFRVWKFRTMIVDGDEILQRHFAENPAAALEWDLTHKLKADPRITRVGRLLRRTSLDELPQIWNVLRGDMSIVGPRPIVEAEVPKYGPAFRLYTHVAPGLTGLWQVSGRNDTSYHRRVELDTEYIRRWTPALDLKLVMRTVKVVLAGRGAY
jgi:lipopolysaccharide/colanic/teichoic acid biosynthesis glycosyltransferase